MAESGALIEFPERVIEDHVLNIAKIESPQSTIACNLGPSGLNLDIKDNISRMEGTYPGKSYLKIAARGFTQCTSTEYSSESWNAMA